MSKANFKFDINKLSSWQFILISIILGCITGLILGQKAIVLRPVGMLFLHAIKLLIVPVVATAIINALVQLDRQASIQRMISKSFVVYLISMIVAAAFGLLIATYLAPGANLNPATSAKLITPPAASLPSISEAIAGFMPANFFKALVDGKIPQLLVISILIGLAIRRAGSDGEIFVSFFASLSKVVFQLVKIIMLLAPIGIFALIADATGANGLTILLPLLKFVLTVGIACVAYIVLYYGSVIYLVTGLNPLFFFKSITSACMLAFSTCSSAATIPESIRCAERGLKVSPQVSSLLIPLGTNFNLNGLAIYLSVAVVFAANYYHIPLNFWSYLTLIFTIAITCAGAGGIPSSALIVMSAVLSSVGLPTGIIALITGVDRLNDMIQTTTNVTGDIFSCYLVAKSEGLVGELEIDANAQKSELLTDGEVAETENIE